MSRRMSCALTITAVTERRKTVTRRHPDSWRHLRPGDTLTLVEKAMGLPKGSKQVVLAEVVVVSNQLEWLGNVDEREVWLEGFDAHMSPPDFRRMWADAHGHSAVTDPYELKELLCRRIAWRYLDTTTTTEDEETDS